MSLFFALGNFSDYPRKDGRDQRGDERLERVAGHVAGAAVITAWWDLVDWWNWCHRSSLQHFPDFNNFCLINDISHFVVQLQKFGAKNGDQKRFGLVHSAKS